MSRREGIAIMHIHALYQRQHRITVILERTDRTLETESVFQYLQYRTARQFRQSEEDGHFYFLPEQREQRQHIEGTFRQHGVIFEESIFNACMI